MKDFLQKWAGLFKYKTTVILSLVLFKIVFQLIVMQSGLMWLTADDFSRTVISWDWLQDPRIYSGVWLSMHFWLNGFFIWLFGDLILAPVIANTLFSVLTLVFLYLLFEKIFGKSTAVISCLIYSVFPFQVWLSASAMPESVFFFFITMCFYFFVLWYKHSNEINIARVYLLTAAFSLNAANMLRYEGWFFTMAFIIIIAVLSFRKFRFGKLLMYNFGISLLSVITILWWLYLNHRDYNDAFFFIRETGKIYEGLNSAGYIQRIVQYPFFILYIAPLTTLLGLWKVIKTVRNRRNGFMGDFTLMRIFLLFNLIELLLLMLSGIVGTGGTNMISRYIVLNAILFFPFAIWQLADFRRYILIAGSVILIVVNIIWSFYYQQAYREDTYEVSHLVKDLIEKNYIAPGDKVYFEMVQGYFDIYPLQVISNRPGMFNTDTIPTYFAVDPPASKKVSGRKKDDEQLKLNIVELRKFIEQKKIKLFIVRSDLLIDKLRKLSYKSEQVGDYHIFYISESKINYKRSSDGVSGRKTTITTNGKKIGSDEISFGKKIILKEFRIDNTNLGMNPQTVTLKWEIADITFLDSLNTVDEAFGRYKARLELTPAGADSTAYDTYTNIFSERNVEEFFDSEEIKNIMILKPFAMLNYSVKFKSSPFESGLYDIRLSIVDAAGKKELPVFIGDSAYFHTLEITRSGDTVKTDSLVLTKKMKEHRERFNKKPYYPIGRIIAMFPNVNYNALMKKSTDLSQVIIRNGFMLPFLNRYQGDHMLDIVFTYF